MTESKNIISKLTIQYMKMNRRRTKAAILGIMGTVMILTTVNIFANTILDIMVFQTVKEEELYSIINAVLVLLMLMGCVMIYNAYAISAFEKMKFLGTIGSIGATKVQKAGIIFLEGLIEGIIAIPVGIGMGILLGKGVISLLQNFLLYEGKISLHLSIAMIGKIFFLGFFMIFLACLIPAWKAAKSTSIDLMSHQVTLEANIIEKTHLRKENPGGVAAALALRNVWVRKKTYIANGILIILTFCLLLDGVAAMRGMNGDYAPRDDREREKLELWSELYTDDEEKIDAFYEKMEKLPEVKKISLERELHLGGILFSKEQLQEDIQENHDAFGIRDYVGFFKSYCTVVDAKTGSEVKGYWVMPYIIGLDENTFREYVKKSGYEFPEKELQSEQYHVLVEDYVTIRRNGKEERREILDLQPGEDFSFKYSKYGDMGTLGMFESTGNNKFDEIMEGRFSLIGTTAEAPPYPYYSGTTEEIDGYQDITLGAVNIYMTMDDFNKLIHDPAYENTYGEHPTDTAAFNYDPYKSIFTYVKFDIEREEAGESKNLFERIFHNKKMEKKIEEDLQMKEQIRQIAAEVGLKEDDGSEVELTMYGGMILPENDTYYFGSRTIVQREKYFHSEKYLLLILGYGMIALITLLSLTNICQNISMSMRIRKREFAVFSSVGMTTGMLRKMLLLENSMYAILGCGLGIPISILLLHEVKREFSRWNEIHWKAPWDMVPLQIVIAMLLIVLPMVHTISQMKRMNMIDTIRNENI